MEDNLEDETNRYALTQIHPKTSGSVDGASREVPEDIGLDLYENIDNLNNVSGVILVMGATGAGKSHFINQLAGMPVVEEGAALKSCTQKCKLAPITVHGEKLLAIDTPGFDDSDRTDAAVLAEIATILCYLHNLDINLKGIFYIHRITDIRFGNSAAKTLEIFRRLCGREALKNVLLVTSRWSEVDVATGEERERQLKDRFWAYMHTYGSRTARFHGGHDSAVELARPMLPNKNTVLKLQRELDKEGVKLEDTSSGAYVNENFEKLRQENRDQVNALEQLKQDLAYSRNNNTDLERRIEMDLHEELSRLQKIDKLQNDLHRQIGMEAKSATATHITIGLIAIHALLTLMGVQL